MSDYPRIVEQLRVAYDGSADERDRADKSAWKLAERERFLERLRSERKQRLLEIGPGTGQDGEFFQSSGLDVTAVDPSAEMVARCRQKGLDARVGDVLHLPDERFDAVYSLNVLLHVPSDDLGRALESIRGVLRPGGLFFLGVYGGEPFEGLSPDDTHEPPRFFCFRTDDELERAVARYFEIVDFHVVEPRADGAVARSSAGTPVHFQSMTLRKPHLG